MFHATSSVISTLGSAELWRHLFRNTGLNTCKQSSELLHTGLNTCKQSSELQLIFVRVSCLLRSLCVLFFVQYLPKRSKSTCSPRTCSRVRQNVSRLNLAQCNPRISTNLKASLSPTNFSQCKLFCLHFAPKCSENTCSPLSPVYVPDKRFHVSSW